MGHNGLGQACLFGHKDVVVLLIGKRILSCPGVDGNTVLSSTLADIHCFSGSLDKRKIECAQLLIKCGVIPTLGQKIMLWWIKNPNLLGGLLSLGADDQLGC